MARQRVSSRPPRGLVVLFLAVVAAAACRHEIRGPARDPLAVVASATSPTRLEAFRSEGELREFLEDLAAAREGELGEKRRPTLPGMSSSANAKSPCTPATCESLGVSCGVHPDGCGGTVSCGACEAMPAPADQAGSYDYEFADEPAEVSLSAATAAAESITNVQHAGVDEGGIVKLRGDHLVVLRRGRLFTIDIGGGRLRPVSSADAFGPDVDPESTWYDEMLVSDRRVVVIGYSYARGGTEVGLFDLDAAGRLTHQSTYHLRSDDYYSSRNYASRLVDDKLIFYTPHYLEADSDDIYRSFPAVRRWSSGADDDDFERIAPAHRVYRPLLASSSLTLHSVSVCELGGSDLDCHSTVVMGPPGRVFYVAPKAVYVWVAGFDDRAEESVALVYRMPLDGSPPTVLRAAGTPVDQFSFLEGADGYLNVLVRSDGEGDAMWDAEQSRGKVALMRVPITSFAGALERVPTERYTALPEPGGSTFQNRFVGDYLLYGTGSGWGMPEDAPRGEVFAHRYAGALTTARLDLVHGVDRIEALGRDAVVIGTDGDDLHFTPVALRDRPWAIRPYTRRAASQGELRSHGFFYRADGDESGLLGLPIREPGRPGYEHLFTESASVLFVQNRRLDLQELGTLDAHADRVVDDACRASCVDWYGNARPLFFRGRVFALLGYEIVEGSIGRGAIREKRRVTFAPVRTLASRADPPALQAQAP